MVIDTATRGGKPYRGFLLGFEPKRTEKIAESLAGYGAVVESFSATDWEFERREVVLLSLVPGRPGVSALALMERQWGSGGTAKLKMRIYDPVEIDWIAEEQLGEVIAVSANMSTGDHVRRLDAVTWSKLIAVIKALRPDCAASVDRLLARRSEDRRLQGEGTRIARLVEQRDALGIVMDIGKLDRRETLRSIDPRRLPKADSVLDLLDSEELQEQDLIRKDQEIFRGLLDQSMRHARFGQKKGRGVRVYVYDKKPLETVLGIDLLIYQEVFRSFILIQYKAMERINGADGKTWSYLVDEQLRTQIEAMERAHRAIESQPPAAGDIHEWRLHQSPFYFKFCETTRPSARDDSLVQGITLELGHLQRFLTLDASKGKHGGRRVGYDNCPRYLNNTQLTDLAKHGWIGCDDRGTQLIEEVLAANQRRDRQAMLAVVERGVPLSARDRGRPR